MKAHKILGFTLIMLSVLFFGVYIWWGTTIYKSDFAVGIIIVAVGTFIAGLISVYSPINETENMNDLTIKLKKEIIKQLTSNEQNMDSEYLTKGDKAYSRSQLAAEIENETPFGIKTLTSVILLSLDLTAREKTR